MKKIPLYHNFERALAKLVEFGSTEIVDDRDRAGIVQAFEFTLEQCWKALQKAAREQGLEAKSPRDALKCGLDLGLLEAQEEDLWLEMLKDRNSTSHIYQEELALAVTGRVLERYMDMFQNVLARMKQGD